ncbi:MAG: hypothetical protein HFG66_02405 [Hungatella sp.]|nr:hypothetical protein [Hungatella sp.]
MNRCQEIIYSGKTEEILCFQYQRMMRYGGKWHMEKRLALPGYVFVAGTNMLVKRRCDVSLTPCEAPYLKKMCQNSALIGISRGIIRNGTVVVTSGPLKGRESLIQKIDRHKRTADIEIPFDSGRKRITVGLEIYEKEV